MVRSELLVLVAVTFQLYLSLLFRKSYYAVSRLYVGKASVLHVHD